MINKGQGGALVEEWVELANGYVCCTVKHSLVQALEQLVQTKERLQIDEHKKSSSFPEAFHQIAFADVVILNKVDLVEDNLEDLERQIHEVNALVTVVQPNSSQLQELLEYSKSVPPNLRLFLPCAFVSKDPVSLAKKKGFRFGRGGCQGEVSQ
uniref:CobW/HypB/UreG nucleotide-binding domain-containing protein n=1 Tax=Oryza meridionalis TaxID=40149 RepID=A0A0E0EDX8_9ORYZ